MKIIKLKKEFILEKSSTKKGIKKHSSKSKNKKIKPTMKKCIEKEQREKK